MVACLTELLRLMEETHYTAVIQIHPKGPPLKVILSSPLLFHRDLMGDSSKTHIDGTLLF